MEILRKQWMRRKEEMLGCFAVLAVGYIIGNLLSGTLEQGAEAFPMGILLGSIFGYGMAIFTHIIYVVFMMPGEFNLAVSLGGTRKQFLQGYLLFGLVELVGVQIAIGILQRLERAAYGALYDGSTMTGSLLAGESIAGYLLLLELGILALETLVGALVLRFGQRVLLGVIGVAALFPSALRGLGDRGLLPEHTPVAQALAAGNRSGVHTLSWGIGFVAVVLLLLAVTWGLLRKQQVTD